jgi:hypothetical protein
VNIVIRAIVLAVGMAIAALLGMTRTTRKQQVVGGPPLTELRAPTPVAILIIVFGGLFAAMGMALIIQRLSASYSYDNDDLAAPLLGAALIGLGGWYAFMGYRFGRVRQKLVTGGIEIEKLGGQKQKFVWADIVSLEFKNKTFVLKSKDGRTAKISVWLRGLPEFARDALTGIPAAAMTPKTVDLMKATAAGKPPNVANF